MGESPVWLRRGRAPLPFVGVRLVVVFNFLVGGKRKKVDGVVCRWEKQRKQFRLRVRPSRERDCLDFAASLRSIGTLSTQRVILLYLAQRSGESQFPWKAAFSCYCGVRTRMRR